MQISKSSRHSKITGDFAEALVLYWLSKYGFECARVDHTGIDLIARNPHTKKRMGSSVKSRCRYKGTEHESVTITGDNVAKAQAACEAFGCSPCFAVVVDAATTIYAFLTSNEHLLRLRPPRQRARYWKMGKKAVQSYLRDPEIKVFAFKTSTLSWWWTLAIFGGFVRGICQRTRELNATQGFPTEFWFLKKPGFRPFPSLKNG